MSDLIISYCHAIKRVTHCTTLPYFFTIISCQSTSLPYIPVYKKPSTHVFSNEREIYSPFQEDSRSIVLTLSRCTHPSALPTPFRRLNDPRLLPSPNFHSSPRASLPLILPLLPQREETRIDRDSCGPLDVEIALIRMIYGRLGTGLSWPKTDTNTRGPVPNSRTARERG